MRVMELIRRRSRARRAGQPPLSELGDALPPCLENGDQAYPLSMGLKSEAVRAVLRPSDGPPRQIGSPKRGLGLGRSGRAKNTSLLVVSHTERVRLLRADRAVGRSAA
jgi:hypothetical protein